MRNLFILSTAETSVKKRVEDVMPIATGHEREELEAELEVVFYIILLLKTNWSLGQQ